MSITAEEFKHLENAKLHLGCGNHRIEGYINIDISQTETTDLSMDLAQLPVLPVSIGCAFSNAFFEHLYRSKRVCHLYRIRQALSKNGFVCYIGIPYFTNVAKFYLDKSAGTAGPVFDLYNVFRYTHGDPEDSMVRNYQAQLHKSLFNEEELNTLLAQAGFTSWAIFEYGFPGDYSELPVNIGFYACNNSDIPLEQAVLRYLKPLDGILIRLKTLHLLSINNNQLLCKPAALKEIANTVVSVYTQANNFNHDKAIKLSWGEYYKYIYFHGYHNDPALPITLLKIESLPAELSTFFQRFFGLCDMYMKHPNAEWFVSLDSRTFIHPYNLQKALATLDPDTAIYAGGPGLFLSRELMKLLFGKREAFLIFAKQFFDNNKDTQTTIDLCLSYYLRHVMNIGLTQLGGTYNNPLNAREAFRSAEHTDIVAVYNTDCKRIRQFHEDARLGRDIFASTSLPALQEEHIITGNRFRRLADCVIDQCASDLFISPDRNIYFVKTDYYLDLFIEQVLPRINFPFILITHNSDHPVNNIALLENKYLIKWYGMNCHIKHPKLQPIPIGIANEEWAHGNKEALVKVMEKTTVKKSMVYCNFNLATNMKYRLKALNELQHCSFIAYDFSQHNYEEYLTILASYSFTISPPGNSIDCHRIWESIYVGTIPIILKHTAMESFYDLPVVVIDNWTDLTEAFLEKKYQEIVGRTYPAKHDFLWYKKMILAGTDT